jgi:hypothetical protein
LQRRKHLSISIRPSRRPSLRSKVEARYSSATQNRWHSIRIIASTAWVWMVSSTAYSARRTIACQKDYRARISGSIPPSTTS